LEEFEKRYKEIEALPVDGDAQTAALNAIRGRQRQHRKVLEEFGCPVPPWASVNPRLIWAIQNVPAAQMSILLGTHGPSWAPVGACATFGIATKLGYDAILRGEARVAIVGTTDPRPPPILVSAFHRARLTPANGSNTQPLTQLLGTHISGGACIWILGDEDYMREQGLEPIGPRVAAAAISSDAYHIITPSIEGPKNAIREALSKSGALPGELAAWDLHATGTPGDIAELELIEEFVSSTTAISARKGLFGHGMANAGGWEMTALAIGLQEGRATPTGLQRSALHSIARGLRADQIVCEGRKVSGQYAVKVMLGIGGTTGCVILSREQR
jgi:3-oxoacyl-(acyl-carrier-protein) synthase